MNPTCCTPSRANRTVTLFVPIVDGFHGITWNVPVRGEDGTIADRLTTPCRFCPFCGVRLTIAHAPFDADGFMNNETREEQQRALARPPVDEKGGA